MDDKVKEKLQALFLDYSKNLPHKIQTIEQEWNALSHTFDAAKLKTLHRDVHSLCGSAGTYGYTGLSKIARQLEVLLKSLLDNTAFTTEQNTEVSRLIKELKAAEALPPPKEMPLFSSPQTLHETNKLVYIIDPDTHFIQELKTSLEQANYTLISIEDTLKLKTAIEEKPPVAIILNTQHLGARDLDILYELQERPEPIPLFCTIDNGDLLPRLQAVRAGCSAFFQKPVDAFYVAKTLDQVCDLSRSEPYRILIVDDSVSLSDYYSVILKDAGMITNAVNNPLQIMNALEEFRPDLLLMDVYMPQCTGLELAAVLRQETMYTKIPIIFLSSEEDRSKQLSALSLGGDDFLTKPILPQHLIAAVKSRAKRAGILNYYMTTDSLTGLLNHTNILQRLDNELIGAKRKGMPLSFVMIDIDYFKAVNDNYGHTIGDLVIRKLSALLLRQLRKVDVVGRYGGEEFAIVLTNSSVNESIKICNNLRDQFAQLSFTADNREFSVTFSAGIATYPQVPDAQHLAAAADQALYQAKHNGRNQVVHYDAILAESSSVK